MPAIDFRARHEWKTTSNNDTYGRIIWNFRFVYIVDTSGKSPLKASQTHMDV